MLRDARSAVEAARTHDAAPTTCRRLTIVALSYRRERKLHAAHDSESLASADLENGLL